MSNPNLKKYAMMLRLMGIFRIPMIGYVSPRLVQIDDENVIVRIRLRRRTKNHLKSMYFGALAVGADVTAGLHAFYFCDELNVRPSFAFKGMKAEFLKRAETDVEFSCDEGAIIREQVLKAIQTNERQNHWVKVIAKDLNGEVVALFEMEISVKIK
jgi:acyl-coenzyme A thioesterase PaaI-like protein